MSVDKGGSVAINSIGGGPALFLLRQINLQTAAITRASERISTGLRINRAADDPAGISMAAKFLAQLGSINSAETNVQLGVSTVQTAEGGLTEIQESIDRIEVLAIQAQGSPTGSELAAIADELEELQDSIDDVITNTTFNTEQMLAGATVTIQTGIDAGQTMTITLPNLPKMDTLNALDVAIDDLVSDINGGQVQIGALASAMETAAENAAGDIMGEITTVGAVENRLDSQLDVLSAMELGTSDALSQIRDADVAAETVELARQQVLQESAVAMLVQFNTQAALVLKLLE